jgi:hypothetical protein
MTIITAPATTIQREQVWTLVPRYLDGLPTEFFQQAMLLTHNLGMQLADSGQFADILRRPQDYPLLDQPFWLLNDWDAGTAPECEALASGLLLATLLQFLARDIGDSLRDDVTFITDEYRPIQVHFLHSAAAQWADLFAPASPFWAHHAAAPHLPDKYQLGALSLAAVAVWSNRQSDLPRLHEMHGHLADVFRVLDDLSTLLVDIRRGRISPPIQHALAAIRAEAGAPLTYEFVMGALILTGTLKTIIQECRARLESARALAVELTLPTFIQHCDALQTTLGQVQGIFSLRPQPMPGALRGFFLPAHDLRAHVLRKAESFLLAEPTFREAWEEQRCTFPHVPNLSGRAFPSALILDVLSQAGHDISAQVDALFEIYLNNGFGYYSEPGWTTPDADDLAFAVRLHRFASRPDACAAHLKTPLRWMRENQLLGGQIPVWFFKNDFPTPVSPFSVHYGGECATVEANLLLSLAAYDWHTYQDVIEPCAHSWCERWLSVGLGATGHYTPLFSLWTSLELTAALRLHARDTSLRQKLDAVSDRLLTRLQTEAQPPNLPPQDAAFLILSSLRANDPRLPLDPRWLTPLYKSQQFDGSWPGEPIYVVPTGRGLTTSWHKSRTITTAFCYHALRQIQSHS